MMYSGPPIPLSFKDACLTPFLVEHIGPLVELMRSWPFAIPDEWRPHAFERYMTLAAAPDSRFYSVEGDGGWQGCVYLTQIVPHRSACRSAWLHGYCKLSRHVFGAVAATRALINLAFRELDLDVVYTEHCCENRAITAVARKAGFTVTGRLPLAKVFDGKLYDSTVLAITRDEWADGNRR